MANATDKPKTGSVTIATVKNNEGARRMANQLKSSGIDCSLVDERDAPLGGLGRDRFGGIKVQVSRVDVERAVQLLSQRAGQAEARAPVTVSLPAAFRFWRKVDGWQRIAIELAGVLAFAGLLAAFLYY